MNNVLISAIAYAAEKHKNQRRKDAEASPYINHPIALANVLANEGGIANIDVICAAVLHDILEDIPNSKAEYEALEVEIEEMFGRTVLSLVQEVTDDKSLDKEERKRLQVEHAVHSSHGAKLVKLADKICNLRDLISSPPADWPNDRIVKYFKWASDVKRGLVGTNSKLEKILDELIAIKVGAK